MLLSSNLGYPRIGLHREIKKGIESYWSGNISKAELKKISAEIRRNNWVLQKEIGIDHIPSNDFSYYDHVLDTTIMAGAVPDRFHWDGDHVNLELYFYMARGFHSKKKESADPMEMTKWFDTNYHYIVPEFKKNQQFVLSSLKALDEFNEAKALGILTRPVLLGPISYLLLGKPASEEFDVLELVPQLLPIYLDMLALLSNAGAEWVQIDEPILVRELEPDVKTKFKEVYKQISADIERPNILLASYFGGLGENESLALSLPVDALHVDLVRDPVQLDSILENIKKETKLSLGVVNGRNIWINDLKRSIKLVDNARAKLGDDRLWISPSCSLLHVPQDIDLETELDPDVASWMAFAKQKLQEVEFLARFGEGTDAGSIHVFEQNRGIINARSSSTKIHDPVVQDRMSSIKELRIDRQSSFSQRRVQQQKILNLPKLPTTTIGSFPQTSEVRKARADYQKGRMTEKQYKDFIRTEIKTTVRFQEEIGLDVLVHGEFERNDMVQYFGEKLSGFTFTKYGWVQSFGTRYVRPPVIYGDVSRPKPMTVDWAVYTQSLTEKPLKGMLTGPITIMKWSFVRDDQPHSQTCRQIALAIRDEVLDLEKAGIKIIQIDEPALREGFPLRKLDWEAYLKWAIESFKLASSGVYDKTQIHTHMCYSEFNDIMDSIAELDADVISIEASRSKMELLGSFAEFQYPNDIGPGVYDIHSPSIPEPAVVEDLLEQAIKVIPVDQLWVNPDCGLKTRKWEEVKPALSAMVEVAKRMRERA